MEAMNPYNPSLTVVAVLMEAALGAAVRVLAAAGARLPADTARAPQTGAAGGGKGWVLGSGVLGSEGCRGTPPC